MIRPAASQPLELRLKLDVGGEVFGPVLDHTEELIVLEYQGFPCAFAFDELSVASAYQAKKALAGQRRGDPAALTAEDHFQLGLYALRRGHAALAGFEFRAAARLDRAYDDRARQARKEARSENERPGIEQADPDEAPEHESPGGQVFAGLQSVIADGSNADAAKINDVYRRFGQSVTERINPDLVLLETDHFLIWTDWNRVWHDRLAGWCERMYAALAGQFGIAPDDPVFLGKCPVFCFRSKASFQRFARTYDGWSSPKGQGLNLIGYAITAPTGHVHVVVYRRADTPFETRRFASTLVHEGTHAFAHRYRRNLNVSGWVGEGLADSMAERVLGDECHYGERSSLVARQVVRGGYSLEALLRTTGLPEAREYPVAHSLVDFLIETDRSAFVAFFNDMKDGRSVEESLGRNYEGMDFRALDAAWRAWVTGRNGWP